jgi:integrase
MAKTLTPIAIAALRPKASRYERPDGGVPGLRVRVFPSGEKSFTVRFRFRGLPRNLTLGSVITDPKVAPAEEGVLGAPLTLAQARELAARALRQAKSGADPCAAKQQAKAQERAAESDTLAAIAQEYLRREGPRLRTLSQRRSDLDLICASVVGRLPVDQIKRGQYTRVLDHIADHNGPVRADRALSALKTLLGWHASRSDFVSPLGRGGRRTSIRDRARSRVLSDDELRAVWMAAKQAGVFGAYVRFLLLTATRRMEAAALRKSELSDDGATWIIPGSRYKSGLDTLIPLSKAAQAIIAGEAERGPFVFSADGSRPMGGFDKRKTEFDKVCGVSDYRLHDLRRTSRTLLSRAGVPADVAERCLGHAMAGVRATYDRHEYEAEKRRAFEALSAIIMRIVHPSDTVVPMRKTGRRNK